MILGYRIEVRAPYGVAYQTLFDFALKHQAWWQERIVLARQRSDQKPTQAGLSFDQGALWSILGFERRLDWCDSIQTEQLLSDRLRLPKPVNDTLQKRHFGLALWWSSYFFHYATELTEDYAARIGRTPLSVGIKHYKSRWGSCDRFGRLTFNWILFTMPEWIVQYVIAHEVAHLEHFNHSPNFWRLVAQLYPNYKQARLWLKQYGHGYLERYLQVGRLNLA